MFELLRIHTDTGVLNLDDDPTGIGIQLRAELDLTGMGEFTRVAEKVDENLLDLRRIGMHREFVAHISEERALSAVCLFSQFLSLFGSVAAVRYALLEMLIESA